MSDEVILTKGEPILTKANPDMLSTFKGFDMSKIQPVDMIPSWAKNTSNTQNVKLVTPEERAKPITDRLDKEIELLEVQLLQSESTNEELQSKLDDSHVQLKQLNNKYAIQTGEIKQLRADLKEESLKRELAESKLSAKDWKTAFIALCSALFTLAIEHWKDIYDFIISLIGTQQ